MEDAEQADQIMMIRRGEAIAQGTPDSLISEFGVSSVEEAFLKAGRQQDENLSND